MPRRRYIPNTRPAVEAGIARGFIVVKQPYRDLAADFHNACHHYRCPSVIVIRPRRYCEVEFSTSTMSADSVYGPIIPMWTT